MLNWLRNWWNAPGIWQRPNRLRRWIFGANEFDLNQDFDLLTSVIENYKKNSSNAIDVVAKPLSKLLATIENTQVVDDETKFQFYKRILKALIESRDTVGFVTRELKDKVFRQSDTFNAFNANEKLKATITLKNNSFFAQAIQSNDYKAIAYSLKEGTGVVGSKQADQETTRYSLLTSGFRSTDLRVNLMLSWLHADIDGSNFSANDPVGFNDKQASPVLKDFAAAVYNDKPIETLAAIFNQTYSGERSKLDGKHLRLMQQIALDNIRDKIDTIKQANNKDKIVECSKLIKLELAIFTNQEHPIYQLFNLRDKAEKSRTTMEFLGVKTPFIDKFVKAHAALEKAPLTGINEAQNIVNGINIGTPADLAAATTDLVDVPLLNSRPSSPKNAVLAWLFGGSSRSKPASAAYPKSKDDAKERKNLVGSIC